MALNERWGIIVFAATFIAGLPAAILISKVIAG